MSRYIKLIMENKPFEWHELPQRKETDPTVGDVRIVELPVKVLFEWSDKIVVDVDENNIPVEFTSGLVMRLLPEQGFVYKGEKTIHLAQAQIG